MLHKPIATQFSCILGVSPSGRFCYWEAKWHKISRSPFSCEWFIALLCLIRVTEWGEALNILKVTCLCFIRWLRRKDWWCHLLAVEICLLKNNLNMYFVLLQVFLWFSPLLFDLEMDLFQEAALNMIYINASVWTL